MLHLDWKTCLRAAVTVVAVWLLVHYWGTLAGRCWPFTPRRRCCWAV